MNDRIENAIQKGESAFWLEIAKEFKEKTNGDFPPIADIEFKQAMKKAVNVWLQF